VFTIWFWFWFWFWFFNALLDVVFLIFELNWILNDLKDNALIFQDLPMFDVWSVFIYLFISFLVQKLWVSTEKADSVLLIYCNFRCGLHLISISLLFELGFDVEIVKLIRFWIDYFAYDSNCCYVNVELDLWFCELF